jgi:phosphotransferase system  glucose/maltose/N-acetylglucosamine-specific IIC component
MYTVMAILVAAILIVILFSTIRKKDLNKQFQDKKKTEGNELR